MRAFIVRPFNARQGVNFDRVQKELIDPALEKANITGDTTAEILEAGNIRVDMFQLLLLADLVIADVTIHNANVFYELGIRHALRTRQTILIRGRFPKDSQFKQDEIPFDIRTDRYLEYDPSNPGSSVATLVEWLLQTGTSERTDSPVFLSLPDLKEQDRSRLAPVPREFREEVDHATAARQAGRLGLLGWEAHGFSWETEGLRITGRAQISLRAFTPARTSWTEIRDILPLDREANLQLGTVYQRLGDLTASDQAVRRALESPGLNPDQKAEAFALLGRNDKTRLIDGWTSTDPAILRESTLRSPYLLSSYRHYRSAFTQDLNHFYSGLNALSVLTIALELIRVLSQIWSEPFASDDEAAAGQKNLEKDYAQLANAVGMSLDSAQARLSPETTDKWLDVSIADHRFLTTQRPQQAAAAYRKALAGASSFVVDSARAQLQLFARLGLFPDREQTCLAEFPALTAARESVPLKRAIIFTGHMIDAPGRKNPRFPPRCEESARAAIAKAVENLTAGQPERTVAIAGGASGGDILFHEAAAALGIPARLRLTLPPGLFVTRSVDPAGESWVRRFYQLVDRLKDSTEVLGDCEQLPGWLRRKENYDVWQRTNLWLLHEALATEATEIALIALWDGQPGDGPGGTQHLVEMARSRGIRAIVLDTNDLFGPIT